MPPPLTPAQPRFLLPKSQKQKAATPLQTGAQQFASTPRFNVSRATPHQAAASHHPPLFSTPAQPSAKFRSTQYEPLSDSIDTSPISSDLPRDNAWGNIPLGENIELDSPSSSASWEHDGERPSKRRRVSVSPVVDATPDDYEASEAVALDDDELMMIHDTPLSVEEGDEGDEHQQAFSEAPHSPVEPAARHPTFLSAPRFKALEGVEVDHSRPPLPDAFSPQRRGAKYTPGGLAAEVRDWLVQVKGPSEYDRPAGESIRFTVEQVMACRPSGMCLITGTEIRREDDGWASDCLPVKKGAEKGQPAKIILAGEGRKSVLDGRSPVVPGKTLSLFQPMWDVDLDRGKFAVACDWT